MFPPNTRILVVDDMSAVRIRATNQLRVLGFSKIDHAEDGQKAFELLQLTVKSHDPFKLVISDWNMPVLSGIDLLKMIRSSPVFKTLPFLMVTAEGEKNQVVSAIKAGASDYVIKPLELEVLKSKLETIWKRTNTLNPPKQS